MKATWSTDDLTVRELIGAVEDRELGLPQFQRPSVWTRANWVPFLRSILRYRPTGSLLLLECSKENQKFAPRAIDTAPNLDGVVDLQNLLLDGQQRLTTLYQAFCSGFKGNNSQYVVQIKDAIESKELLDEHFDLLKPDRIPSTPHDQARDGIISLQTLYNKADFERWKGAFVEEHYLNDDRDRGDLIEDLDGVMGGAQDIGSYRFPILKIQKDASLEVIVDIFEQMNRRGQRLSPFDLMVARLYQKFPNEPKHYDLREVWETELSESSNLQIVGIREDDGMLPLQLIAKQVSRKQSGSKVKGLNNADVLELEQAQVTGIGKPEIPGLDLKTAIKAFEEAANFLVRVCGVCGPQLLPQKAMLLPLADQFLRDEGERLTEGKMKKWFFCTALRADYHGSSNSYANRHCDELSEWAEHPSETAENVREFTSRDVHNLDLKENNSRENGIIGRAVMALLVARGAIDWVADPLQLKEMPDVEVQIHHMVPKSRLKNRKITNTDPIAGLTPITASTNQSLKDKNPRDVLKDLAPPTVKKIVETHHVDEHLLKEGWESKAKFNQMLKQRETDLKTMIIADLELEAD